MGDRDQSSHRHGRRGRRSRQNQISLDLSDLNSAMRNPPPSRTHTQPQSTPANSQEKSKTGRSNPQAGMVTPNPQWAAFQASNTQQPQPIWTSLPYTQSTLDKLLLLCHSNNELKKEGYVLRPLTEKILLSKMRCTHCYARKKGGPSKREPPKRDHGYSTRSKSASSTSDSSSMSASSPVLKKPRYSKKGGDVAATFKASPKPEPAPLICFYHTGKTVHRPNKVWSCCGRHWTAQGCKGSPSHTFSSGNDPNLLANWKYHHARPATGALTPSLDPRAAVALDCEMGTAVSGESELIRLTAVDFFTGATLIDRLVAPNAEMKHMNTKYSGVTNAQMGIAKANRTCFFGRDAARESLLQYVGPNTVMVMHGGSSDLTALRLLHPYVVDSFILEGYHGKKVEGGKSLKNLMKLKTGMSIQNRGKAGHDSLEDALSARELVIRFMQEIPDY